MNRNRNLIIEYRINGTHDHYINKDKHTVPHNSKKYATKKNYRNK